MLDPKLDITELLPLSPIDHVYVGANALPITLLFRFATPPDAERLAAALAEVLDVFSPMRGQLVLADRASYAIELGPWDLETHWRVEKVGKLPQADDLEALASCVDAVKTVVGEPLFRAKLTVAPEGAWLATSISHAVADGYSHFLFLDAWARAARGERFPTPVLDRSVLVPPVSPLAPRLTTEDFFRRTTYRLVDHRFDPSAQKIRASVCSWTAAQTAEFFDRHVEGGSLSLNDALVAWAWKELGASWYTGHAKRRLTCAVDYRRYYPGLGPLYFGNAVASTYLELDAKAWEQLSIAELALGVRESVGKFNLSRARDFLLCLEEVRHQIGAGAVDRIDPSPAEDVFFVSNFSRFPLRQLDFGTGAPERMRVPLAVPRAVLILPVAGGGLDLQIHAPEERS